MPRKLLSEHANLIKMLANSEPTKIETWFEGKEKESIFSELTVILQEYYRENTQQIAVGWTEEFENQGINEDDGKAAIACARRLGMIIS